MAGRGGVVNEVWDGVIPAECEPNPSIMRFNSHLKWVEAQEPLHVDIGFNKTCGVGPGMAFANTLLQMDSSNIDLWWEGLFVEIVRKAQLEMDLKHNQN
ncbi:hypothetical protein MKW94_029281 [Papaver nudicaule]|uniref:Sialate O-acetylesterase domain-containing protein n=1 Tax=Papaver nudicaule TaxID=74823 RepID=A0AA41VAH5_PAPNU|nr:hypothetical protein [Papaver nudicaule]